MLFMGASIAAIRLQRLTDPYVSLTDVGFWPNADAETCLTIRPLSGVKRMCSGHARTQSGREQGRAAVC